MLSKAEADLCHSSYQTLMRNNAGLVDEFYDRLFRTAPQLRALFPEELERQQCKFRATLQVVLSRIEHPEELVPALRLLGIQHARYGAVTDHYTTVAEVLIDTLAEHAGPGWSEETSVAWHKLLAGITAEMLTGAQGCGQA